MSKRTKRIPIMMTDDELLAVDDFRFAHRITTRSEAIRQLCRLGLEAALEAPTPPTFGDGQAPL